MYTLQQQAFTLSFFSNAASSQTGTVAQLQTDATTTINTLLGAKLVTDNIGTWQIVWGPIVVQEDSNVADNVMVVYQGTSGGNPVYVAGVAATNGLSKFDVQVEDLGVASTVPFGSHGATISVGTSTGVRNLEAMTDPNGGTLQSFLQSKAARNATLIFAGHSLGGALAPALALDLAVNQGFDITQWANVHVYPSAGPTPGNKAFSGLFAQTFPPQQQTPAVAQPWNVWNMDVVNSLDIVPRAWSELPSLPKLYPQLGPGAQFAVTGLVTTLTVRDGINAQGYMVLPTSSFSGTYNQNPHTAPQSILSCFVPHYYNEAYYQHIGGYIDTIIPELSSLFPQTSTS